MIPNALKRLVRRAAAAAPSPAIAPRSAYKPVWNDLADTESRAKMHVIGSEREEDFAATAIETKQILESTVCIRSDDTILEIGCGVGRVGQALAPVCRQWIGCDVSSNMLEHTRKRLQSFPNVKLVEISGFDLKPIPDASVDLVYCTIVFMHLDEWDRYNYVLEARRVLRPGGRIFIDNFSLCSDEGWGVFETHRTVFPPNQRPSHISKSSTPQELETYLRRAGFQDVQGTTESQMVRYWGVKQA
jgi:ubiquinone/menaquinone biosynthesis C-methylase UbiE